MFPAFGHDSKKLNGGVTQLRLKTVREEVQSGSKMRIFSEMHFGLFWSFLSENILNFVCRQSNVSHKVPVHVKD